MAIPVPTVEMAFGDNWDDTTPTWVALTDVAAVAWDRRYSWESGVYSGGRLTVTVTDTNRQYDPLHTTGPYYGNLEKPGTQIRVTEVQAAVTRVLWRGFLDRVTRSYSPHGRGSTTFAAVDLWSLISSMSWTSTKPTVRSEELVLTRVAAALTAVGVPSAYATSGSGSEQALTLMPAKSYSETSVRDLLAEVGVAEQGLTWVNREGILNYMGRYYAAATRMQVDQATLSNVAADSSVIRYAGPVEVEWDQGDVVNSAAYTRTGGVEQTYSDATSVARYGRRYVTADDVEVISDLHAYGNAVRVVTMRKDPLLRLPPARFAVIDDSGTEHEHACLRDLWDRVRYKLSPPGGGATIDTDAHIVGVSQTWRSEGESPWLVEWELVDAALFDRIGAGNWFILDSSSLDGANILGY